MICTVKGDQITIEMTRHDCEMLLWVCGLAAGSVRPAAPAVFWRIIEFANRLNEGNPNFTPYEIPEEFR
jgi:hypothetical protein